MEGVLKEQLSEHYASLMSSLSETDPTHSCTIPPEDLRKLLQQYGLPLSDSHFNKSESHYITLVLTVHLHRLIHSPCTHFCLLPFSRLCTPFMESGAVNYKSLLTSLGMCTRKDETKSVNKDLHLIQRLVSRLFRILRWNRTIHITHPWKSMPLSCVRVLSKHWYSRFICLL